MLPKPGVFCSPLAITCWFKRVTMPAKAGAEARSAPNERFESIDRVEDPVDACTGGTAALTKLRLRGAKDVPRKVRRSKQRDVRNVPYAGRRAGNRQPLLIERLRKAAPSRTCPRAQAHAPPVSYQQLLAPPPP